MRTTHKYTHKHTHPPYAQSFRFQFTPNENPIAVLFEYLACVSYTWGTRDVVSRWMNRELISFISIIYTYVWFWFSICKPKKRVRDGTNSGKDIVRRPSKKLHKQQYHTTKRHQHILHNDVFASTFQPHAAFFLCHASIHHPPLPRLFFFLPIHLNSPCAIDFNTQILWINEHSQPATQ